MPAAAVAIASESSADEGPSAAELQRAYDERKSRQSELFAPPPAASNFDPLPVPVVTRAREVAAAPSPTPVAPVAAPESSPAIETTSAPSAATVATPVPTLAEADSREAAPPAAAAEPETTRQP